MAHIFNATAHWHSEPWERVEYALLTIRDGPLTCEAWKVLNAGGRTLIHNVIDIHLFLP